MKIETEEQRMNAVVLGALATEKAIRKDPNIIQMGYQKVMHISQLVDDLIRGRNLPESELVDVAVELKDGVVNQLGIVRDALENLVGGGYEPSKVAHALSTCCATLNYVRTKYS
jgi:hypothetical protein